MDYSESASAVPAASASTASGASSAAASASTGPRGRGHSCRDGATSCPEDVERLFEPVLLHRIFFKPSFLAEARERGWAAASADVRAAALERAPRPGLDLVLEGVPPTAL